MQKVLLSKISSPSLSEEIIQRNNLHLPIDDKNLRVISVVAPAGYGKTTFVVQSVQSKAHPCAWLSIDAYDNDPIRFWKHFISAVAKASNPAIATTLEPFVQTFDSTSAIFLMDSLLYEIQHIAHPIKLVLDDFHLLENSLTISMLTYFIEHLPINMTLYITSRSKLPFPTATWQVKRWLHEITKDDLKFTFHELEQLFNQHQTIAHPTKDELAQLLDYTEGWIAGLILVRYAVESNVTIHQDTSSPLIYEYMLIEILNSLPDSVHQFLMETSLLPQLELQLCRDITQDDNADAILKTLVTNGLFTSELNTNVKTYRYHQLFKTVLQQQLHTCYDDLQMNALVDRVLHVLLKANQVKDAINLALKYKRFDQAVHLIDQQVYPMVINREIDLFYRWVLQLRENNNSLKIVWLVLCFEHALTIKEHEVAQSLYEEIEQLQLTEQWRFKEENRAITNAYDRTLAYGHFVKGGDVEEVIAMLLPQVETVSISNYWYDVPMVYNSYEYTIIRSAVGRRGHLTSIEDTKKVADLFLQTDFKRLYFSAFISGSAAEIAFERGQFADARYYLQIAIERAQLHQDYSLLVPMYLLKAKYYVNEQRAPEALALLQAFYTTITAKHWRLPVQIMLANVYLAMDDYQKAYTILEETTSNHPFWLITKAHHLIAIEQFAEAYPLVMQVKLQAIEEDQRATFLEALILEVKIQLALAQHDLAKQTAKEALLYGVKNVYIRTLFEDFDVRTLLHELLKDQTFVNEVNSIDASYLSYVYEIYPLKPTTHSLTKLEQDILRELKLGKTNREIAQTLFLAEGTVRVYLSTIYSKLEVKTRSQAILK